MCIYLYGSTPPLRTLYKMESLNTLGLTFHGTTKAKTAMKNTFAIAVFAAAIVEGCYDWTTNAGEPSACQMSDALMWGIRGGVRNHRYWYVQSNPDN